MPDLILSFADLVLGKPLFTPLDPHGQFLLPDARLLFPLRVRQLLMSSLGLAKGCFVRPPLAIFSFALLPYLMTLRTAFPFFSPTAGFSTRWLAGQVLMNKAILGSLDILLHGGFER